MRLLQEQDGALGQLGQPAAAGSAARARLQAGRTELGEALLPGVEGVAGEADQRGEVPAGQAAPLPGVQDQELLRRGEDAPLLIARSDQPTAPPTLAQIREGRTVGWLFRHARTQRRRRVLGELGRDRLPGSRSRGVLRRRARRRRCRLLGGRVERGRAGDLVRGLGGGVHASSSGRGDPPGREEACFLCLFQPQNCRTFRRAGQVRAGELR